MAKKNSNIAPQGSLFKNLLTIVLLFIFLTGIFSLLGSSETAPKEVTLNELSSAISSDQVEKLEVKNLEDVQEVDILLKNGEKQIVYKDFDSSLEATLREDYGVDQAKISALNISRLQKSAWEIWGAALLPTLITLIFLGFLLWIMFGRAQQANSQAMSFGKSTARFFKPGDPKKKVTFADVAGAREAKEELREVVEFLKNPEKFQKLGARIPRGVLLLGAPGTGKTLLAKAVAGEADAPFFNISGSEFVEMFVGVGASRVRDLFKNAKKSAPSILFIDEIDAVGRHRGAGLGGGHDEREQTLNQILVEMDGFDTKDNVIVLAATNRPDVLDPALLRPGRFDRRVMIDMPDIRDRKEILEVHAKNKPLAKDVDLQKVAQRTPGFSGAELFNLLNEAAILTAKHDKKTIGNDEILESIEKVMMGPERKGKVYIEKEKKITAYHEAGHAIVGHILPNTDPIHKISIISRGHAAGYTLNLPQEDKNFHTRSEFLDELAMLLGGYAAEKIIFDDLTTGASNDLKRASDLARKLVTKFGMSEKMGPVVFGEHSDTVFLGKEIHEQRNYSEKIASEIDTEIEKFIADAYKKATEVIQENKEKLEKVTKRLMEVEVIEKEEFEALMQS
ncbi:MAG: ATP-dependent zinc metalloprotease FtsH [Candidatus Pacebacteria bacterium]|nr:ATP-dependent zinc metalloprotease FtsH [Candidatus Paceibacterota bacterium]